MLKRIAAVLLLAVIALALGIALTVLSRLYWFAGTNAQTMAAYQDRLDTLRQENAATVMELDSYGGWVNAPESFGPPEPGDYFRVKKINGAWWFITPEGHPFVSKGVTDVNWLGATLSQDAFHEIMIRKYGNETAWTQAAHARMLEWGFNTAGPWSSHSMTPLVPHSNVILDSAAHAPRHPNSLVTDYWSPEFAAHAAATAQTRAAPHAEDKNLMGYFLDNELVWGADHFLTNKTLLQLYVEFPSNAPGRSEALRFVRAAAGDLHEFNAAWGTSITGWDQLESLSSKNIHPKTPKATAVTQDFAVAAFHQYAKIAIAGLRGVDPHHLLLGCRFHVYPGDALVRAAAEYFDVISMASYAEMPPVKEIDAICNEVDKPFFIEEWSFKSRGTGLLNIQMYAPVVPNQHARALAYDAFVEAFMRRPYAIGYHWYKWMDNPWPGISDIIRGDNFGLMNYRDEPYEPFVVHVREVNRRVETWHTQGIVTGK